MKFTIRDLMLVTVIVALAVGWWIEKSKRVAKDVEINDLRRQLGSSQVEVYWLKEEMDV
jgi:hypothetical protein